jgi:hypothetical protein
MQQMAADLSEAVRQEAPQNPTIYMWCWAMIRAEVNGIDPLRAAETLSLLHVRLLREKIRSATIVNGD